MIAKRVVRHVSRHCCYIGQGHAKNLRVNSYVKKYNILSPIRWWSGSATTTLEMFACCAGTNLRHNSSLGLGLDVDICFTCIENVTPLAPRWQLVAYPIKLVWVDRWWPVTRNTCPPLSVISPFAYLFYLQSKLLCTCHLSPMWFIVW